MYYVKRVANFQGKTTTLTKRTIYWQVFNAKTNTMMREFKTKKNAIMYIKLYNMGSF